MSDVPIMRQTLTQYQNQNVQFSQGPAQLANQVGGELAQIGKRIDEQAKKKYLLDSTITMKQELFRIEQENQGEPERMGQDFERFKTGYIKGIKDPAVADLLNEQYVNETLPYIRRAGQIKQNRLDSETETNGLVAADLAIKNMREAARGMFSNDPEMVKMSVRGVDVQKATLFEIANMTKADGSFMYPPQKRAALLTAQDEVMKEAALLQWSERTDDERIAIVDKTAASKDMPLSVRNNNPGNIRGKDGEFLKFATPQQGLAAMENDLKAKISGNSPAMKAKYGENYVPTIESVINVYAPPSENDTKSYVATVAKETGIDPKKPLTTEDIAKIMPAMIKVEGGSKSDNYFKKTGTEFDYLTPAQQAKAIEDARDARAIKEIQFAPRDKRIELYNSASDQVKTAVVKFEKMLAEDPAGYVAQSPELKLAAMNVQMNPSKENMQQYLNANMAKQRELGVPESAIRVLPKEDAKSIVSTVTDQFANKQDVWKYMRGLSDQYGDQWPRVVAELRSADLPSGASVIAMMDKPEQEAPARLIAEAISDGKDLAKALPQGAEADFKKSIDSALADFMEVQGRNIGGGKTIAEIKEGVTLLASKMVQKGKSPTVAVKEAADIVVNKYYTFHSSFMVPRDYNGGNIEAAADYIQSTLDTKLVPLPSSSLLQDYSDKEYLSHVRVAGMWLNDPMGDGLVLADSTGAPVIAADGNFIKYSFDELSKMDTSGQTRKKRLDTSRSGALP